MTRIDDAAKTLTDWADSEGGLESVARGYDGDLTGAVEALDADGHLLPDLPKPEIHKTTGKPMWLDGLVEPVQDAVGINHFGYMNGQDDLIIWADTARHLAYGLLAAADYAEEHANDQ